MAVESPPPPSESAAPKLAERPLVLLRESPVLGPVLLGTVLLVVLGAAEGGIEPTVWRPFALVFLALLAVALVALPRPRPPRAAVVAAVGLAAYAAWCFLSIAWADSQGPAVEGAGRALMYAIVFALFALWPLRGSAPALVAGTVGLGIAAIGLVELLRVGAAADPTAFMFRGRVSEPVGYANANAAFWMVGLVPCLLLSVRREVPALLRGVLLGSAGLLAGLALLGQSRAWLIALPVVVLVAIAITPGRGRLIVAIGVLGLGVLAMLDPVLAVYEASGPGSDVAGPIDDAVRAIVFTAVGLTLFGAVVAAFDSVVKVSDRVARDANTVVVGLLAFSLVVGALAIGVRENPVDRVQEAWNELKAGDPSPSASSGESRLTQDLSSNRYDFWSVAWTNFEREPLIGVGADNFQQDYQQHGDSSEAPRYPHSLQMSVLSETGLIGALLLFGAFAAALFAAAPGLRASNGWGAAGSSAGVLIFTYLVTHGSVDWLWEFPALGGIGVAMLGVAVAARPRTGPADAPRPSSTVARGLAIAGALVAVVLLVPPWLSEREIERSLKSDASFEARLDRLDRAATLNPFSGRPDLAAGSIAIYEDDLAIAAEHFEAALENDPRSAYAALMSAAIESERGRQALARRFMARAVNANPNNDVTVRMARRLRRGGQLDAREVARELVEATRERTAPVGD